MSFLQDLERVAGLIDGYLDRLLAVGEASDSAKLVQAMRYAALGPGKRLRPYLLISTARIFGVADASSLAAAAALECVHCYSLVHDDLPSMDNDAMRRGRPTVHVAFDEATAILAGDALLTLAFEILSGPGTDRDPEIRSELVALLAKSAGWQGMARGQALDLAAEGRNLTVDEVLTLQSLKTGALFKFACEAGAVLGRASPDARTSLAAYAAALGQAFQLADDLLDAEGTEAAAGKAVAKDAGRGKATLVGLLGADAAKVRLAELVQNAENGLAPFGAKANSLVQAARFIAGRKSEADG